MTACGCLWGWVWYGLGVCAAIGRLFPNPPDFVFGNAGKFVAAKVSECAVYKRFLISHYVLALVQGLS